MILQAGEREIGWEAIPRAVSSTNAEPVTGRLHLTNLGLVFEALAEERSLGYVPRTLLDLNLGQITNVNSFRKSKKESLLRVESGPYWVYTFTTANAEKWVEAISSARTTLQAAAAKPTAPAPQRQQTPSQPLVFLHCTHCGLLNPAGSIHCGSCGARL